MREKAASRQEVEWQRAYEKIESFEKRFGKPHLWLAYHGAFPLVVNPDLLYCIWANFQRDKKGRELEIPWIAVADLLFSGLLREVGSETYQMDKTIRNILLKKREEEENFGQQRIRELAQFLLVYVQPLLKSDDLRERHFAQAQECTALAYTKPMTAVRRLADYYGVVQESGTELVRMELLVETLAELLGEFRPLLIYAKSLGNYARGHILLATEQLREVGIKEKQINLAGVSLPIPKEIQTNRYWSRRKFIKIAAWTALIGGGLTTALVLQERFGKRKSELILLPVPDQMILRDFNFTVKTVNEEGQVIEERRSQAKSFSQDLGNGVILEMVAIPGGKFLMGTEDEEIERLVEKFNWEGFRRENPQREVTVQPFFMSKFLVTQAQWRAISSVRKVKDELRTNPSNFKGDDRPVEQVSWEEAEEFCKRLSSLIKGGHEYQLPSKVQWEYACRAGTITPFHFGETIKEGLANYYAREIYANEPKGEPRRETTAVGIFSPNSFGLYDIHGNVWEWCQDDWHENYPDLSTDDSAWISENNSNIKVIRSDSWDFHPEGCRSAYRNYDSRGLRSDVIGFRVVCVVPSI